MKHIINTPELYRLYEIFRLGSINTKNQSKDKNTCINL